MPESNFLITERCLEIKRRKCHREWETKTEFIVADKEDAKNTNAVTVNVQTVDVWKEDRDTNWATTIDKGISRKTFERISSIAKGWNWTSIEALPAIFIDVAQHRESTDNTFADQIFAREYLLP